jgi:FAD/FMN-containing dehydrogenase
VLKVRQCQFAVKSGGLGSFVGASNINGGVAIDLRGLKSLTVSPDRTQVSVTAGLVWSEVYDQLDAVNLSVIGDTSGGIEVGGLTPGGGISYFSGRFGWACDNVNNYQVRNPFSEFYTHCSLTLFRLSLLTDSLTTLTLTRILTSISVCGEAEIILALRHALTWLSLSKGRCGEGKPHTLPTRCLV